MTPETIERIESSFALLAPRAEELTALFYTKLFAAHPGVRPLFPDDMTEQGKKLAQALGAVVAHVRHLDKAVPMLKDLGARHVDYGTEPAHYGAVRDCLLVAMEELAGEVWNPTLKDDWTLALNTVAEVMLQGAEERSA